MLARSKLSIALAKLDLMLRTMSDPPSVDVAKALAEALKSFTAGGGKDTFKSIQAKNFPAELKQKIAASPPDHVLTVVLGAALLWEWIKKLREPRSNAASPGNTGR